MYSGLKYLVHPISDTLASNNNRMSGGFPHSDIHGSKPIPGSPWLNAGYHVLHRLLLPRHPPNALFALDLIQKEQGHELLHNRLSCIKSILTHRAKTLIFTPVSVLDLEQYHSQGRTLRCIPYSGASNDTDVFSLYDVKGRNLRYACRLKDQTSKHCVQCLLM